MIPRKSYEPAISTLSTLFSEDKAWIDRVADQFETEWQKGGKPEIKQFLGDATGSRRLDLLLELVQIDWSCRWKAGEHRRAEDYLADWQELQTASSQLTALLRCERELRKASGESPSLEELTGRFPDLNASALRDIVDPPAIGAAHNLADDEPLPQQIGPYTIRRQLGKGGFGRVLLGRDEAMDIAVAIKVPGRDLIRSARARDEFLHEVRHVARLRHDAIVRALGFGGEADEDCYIAYEFIEGESLADRLKRGRPGWGETVQLVARVADALHYAHLQGVVHRDIKPANILLDRQGRPYVADFGLAIREENLHAERGRLAGTCQYMTPEQVRREGHRVNNCTDIYSLGVVFYEMLTGQRPFRAASQQELFEQIQFQEPRPPRTIDESIPREVERICLKALAKRMSDRYTTAADMADELRLTIAPSRLTPATPVTVGQPAAPGALSPNSPEKAESDTWPDTYDTPRSPPATPVTRPPDSELQARIMPKGLRSFDAADADFFLELLPGPRDRDGLPESLRFWKRRIEEKDPDETFRVGLIYGPSGCGKSSLVKAGLLPRLAKHVVPIYVEATGDTTEARLLRELAKRFPDAVQGVGLRDALANLRANAMPLGNKLLIVLDQFEQWLHARRGEEHTELAQALRQCDGGRVQCLLMVRDDFWMAATRFMADLEVNLVQGDNCAAADLFTPRHARKVLTAFGRALSALPDQAVQASKDHHAFIDQAVAGLAHDGKIICVRLALFAEMVKGKAWTPETLRDVGGTEGVGVTFLEETFSAATANPKHRLHQRAARAVLRGLLPEQGTDIKGRMRTRDVLLDVSGYRDRPRDFEELIHTLDQEVRLITPTDPEGVMSDDPAPQPEGPSSQCYQLTHDYLVPAIRTWLTRKQKETWRGRAELRLEERTAQWTRSHESRFLPNLVEYVSVVAGVPRSKRLPDQRRLMRAAGRRYGAMTALAMVLAAVLGWAGWEANGRVRADGLVRAIRNAAIDQVPDLVSQLEAYRRWTGPGLTAMRSDASNPHAQLHAALALLPADHTQADYLEQRLLACDIQELPVIRDMLRGHAGEANESMQARLRDLLLDGDADGSRRFNAALALATYEPDGPAWTAATASFVVDRLLSANVDFQSQYRAALQSARRHLVDAVAAAASDPARDSTQRILAANALADFGRDRPDALVRTLVVSNQQQYAILLAAVSRNPQPALPELKRQLDVRPQRVWPYDVELGKFIDLSHEVAAKVENAAGLVHPRFALCQALPLADFAALSESLRASGYRPVRLRPYAASGAADGGVLLQCAALWQRDGREWAFRTGLTAESLLDADREMLPQGFEPVDVAPYHDRAELRYAMLWGRADSQSSQDLARSRPTVEVGLTQDEVDNQLAAGELVPAVLQAALDPRTSDSRVAVIWRRKAPGEEVLPVVGGNDSLTLQSAKYGNRDALDIGLFQTPVNRREQEQPGEALNRLKGQLGRARYTAVWVGVGADGAADSTTSEESTGGQGGVDGTPSGVRPLEMESAESHGLDITAHLNQCRDLAAAGYRPRSLSVAFESLATASIWVRPHLSESVLDKAAHRNALAAVGLLQLGGRDSAWQILKHEGDPRQRSYWIHEVRPRGVDARILADRLKAAQDDQERFALLQALGEYDPPGSPLASADSSVDGIPTWRREVVNYAVRLYRESPRRDLHAASRWLLTRWGEERAVEEIDVGRARSRGPREGDEWFTNGQGLTMIVLPAGEFWMGSPATERQRLTAEVRHPVAIKQPFAIADREITRELFERFYKDAFTGQFKVNIERYSPRRDNGPIVAETWFEALAFCRWLSDQEGIDSERNCLPSLDQMMAALRPADGQLATIELPEDFVTRPGYRLPTEAEWEYACRAGMATPFHFGSDRALLGHYAWIGENSGRRTRPGGQLKPNDSGLFDMHGNVWEWCLDWYGPYDLSRLTNPVSPASGQYRIMRGGCWEDSPLYCRSAYRAHNALPANRDTYRGFRVVCGL